MTYAATTAIITYQGQSQYPTRDWQEWMGLPASASVSRTLDTSSVASVSGSIEVRLATEQASQATLEDISGPLSNVVTTESKAISSAVRAALLLS
ncbi:hypothetical protein AGABI2DRAFT_119651 [Agaricus bisporus var. bisporus H97]|uniref:hypothetical protein n=1 Tax=Agaricus bisporus var. bisporus (strain H97 / ATCC MYA-4626 / FGSC 10389) TaxID=936046 RepID=UPI00029F54E1|nr:hypothetical protein AGABI2DRAFT_119651 [Agaricus bisporus var. bisporus H97]EKV45993.1 hypothetical protein AGABI2DRAFT_119651 [Agaricus bisporus var. bisporus H97]